MFGLGWAELLVVGIVALVVIGPKDLPEMFRQLGRFTAKARAMAGEFSRAMEQAAKESGAADVAKDLKNVASAKSMGLDKVRAAVDGFEKWQPLAKETAKVQPLTPPPIPPNPAAKPPPKETAAVDTAPVPQSAPQKAAPKAPSKPRAPRSAATASAPAKPKSAPKAKT